MSPHPKWPHHLAQVGSGQFASLSHALQSPPLWRNFAELSSGREIQVTLVANAKWLGKLFALGRIKGPWELEFCHGRMNVFSPKCSSKFMNHQLLLGSDGSSPTMALKDTVILGILITLTPQPKRSSSPFYLSGYW